MRAYFCDAQKKIHTSVYIYNALCLNSKANIIRIHYYGYLS